jgi:GNAT superfamily N-acetyltransferase
VGVVTYFMDYEAARYLPAPVRDLLHVAVDPAWHGRGIASALVERAMLWASEKTQYIQVGTQTRSYAANALYGKMGFTLADSQYSLHGYWRESAGR